MKDEEFLDKLIEYCTDKPHRGRYLKELKNCGVFTLPNPRWVAREYLIKNTEICEEGRDRALEALGLEAVKPKPQTGITRYVIDVKYELSNPRGIYGDGDLGDLGSADCGTVWSGFYKMKDGISGTKPNGNVPVKVELVAYRTNVEAVEPFKQDLLNDPSNVCLGKVK